MILGSQGKLDPPLFPVAEQTLELVNLLRRRDDQQFRANPPIISVVSE